MSEPADQHLLSAWAKRRDEAAFRSLLGRYAGFVYGAALRRVGEAGLAEEIAQDVFARLSHHAGRLAEHPSVAGWLHRATMLLALDRLRRRGRHDRKLAEFSAMNTTSPERDPWAEAHPHLDDALDRLSPRDRDVLMLHFAERLTFPEIAERIGLTADAVRMRASRALSALSQLLRQKGVVIPVAMLSAGLAGTFTNAAPAALLALTPAALVGTGKAGVLSVFIHAMQTTKTAKTTAAAVLALLLSGPLIFQQREISAAEARLDALRKQTDTPIAEGASASVAPGLLAAAVARKKKEINLKKLGEDALDGSPFAVRRIREAVAHLDNNNLAGLIETVPAGVTAPRQLHAVRAGRMGRGAPSQSGAAAPPAWVRNRKPSAANPHRSAPSG